MELGSIGLVTIAYWMPVWPLLEQALQRLAPEASVPLPRWQDSRQSPCAGCWWHSPLPTCPGCLHRISVEYREHVRIDQQDNSTNRQAKLRRIYLEKEHPMAEAARDPSTTPVFLRCPLPPPCSRTCTARSPSHSTHAHHVLHTYTCVCANIISQGRQLTSAPSRSSRSTTSWCPPPAAIISGVRPYESTRDTPAPASTNNRAISAYLSW